MQSRLAIVLMSVAGTAALFGIGFLLGLGVMSTPKPEQHKEIALTTKPTKVTRAETTASGKSDDRALTPIYPAAPAGAAAQGEQTAPTEQASAKSPAQAAEAQPAPAPQPQTAAATPQASPAPEAKDQPKDQAKDEPKPETPSAAASPAPVQTAEAEPAPAAQPSASDKATPVSLESRKACDVSACSRAYRSFRESDCTYQPYSGPRQLCVSPPGAKEASRAPDTRQASRGDDEEPSARVRVHRPGRDVELDNVVREVERITDGRRPVDNERPFTRRYHRDFTADGEDDRIDHGGGRGFFFDSEYDDQ